MESLFEEMKRFVRFSTEDVANLALLRPLAAPHLPWLAERFYERILAHPGAHKVFTGPEQVERLKDTMQQWADSLLRGPHDEEYYRRHSRIGRTHVRVGLEQVYMFTAMHVIRQCFRQIIFQVLPHDEPLRDGVLMSVHKALDLELGIMLQSYREDYIARLHRSEQQAALKRLAAIGEVAASVAHEVRNPLAGISGAIQVIGEDLPPDSPRREVIGEILGQIRRLETRVRDLLLYSRRVEMRAEPVDPADLFRSTLSLMSEEPLLHDVRSRVVVSESVGPHPMDRGQMVEVLVNLIRNAADAMHGRGEILLSAERRDGGALALTVEDSGPGVPPGRIEEIFKPFFTTRPGGTGLGLAICRKAVEAHGGSLTCEPGALGGARFVALLPPAPPPIEPFEGAA